MFRAQADIFPMASMTGWAGFEEVLQSHKSENQYIK